MTGTVELDLRAKSFSKMILDIKPSPKNLELLNKLCEELVISQSKPLLEFVDIIIEKFMYPRPSSASLMDVLIRQECAVVDDEDSDCNLHDSQGSVKYEAFDLGHPRLLELIIIRQKLTELKATPKLGWEPNEFISKLLSKVQKVYLLLVHLLQVLSDHIEVTTNAKFYREIVIDSISEFQHAFESFKSLDYICQSLIKNVQKSGKSDEKIFYVDDTLLIRITDFIDQNTKWYENIILKSVAFKEFSLVENQSSALEVETSFIKLIHESKFEKFLDKRKSRLRISNRRVF